MIKKIRRWFWQRSEALNILRVIRREQMLYKYHPRFRNILGRIQDVLREVL